MELIHFVILTIISLSSISSVNSFDYKILKGRQNPKFKHNKEHGVRFPRRRGIIPPQRNHPKRVDVIKTIDAKNLEPGQRGKFLAYCIVSGLTTNDQISKAYQWALQNRFIRGNNNIEISLNDFTHKVHQQFKIISHRPLKIEGPIENGHFWIVDSKGYEIFNSKGIGNHDK